MKQLNLFTQVEKTPPPSPPRLEMITMPRGRAGEYNPWAVSMYSGCGHK
jgi:hypothetical protein